MDVVSLLILLNIVKRKENKMYLLMFYILGILTGLLIGFAIGAHLTEKIYTE